MEPEVISKFRHIDKRINDYVELSYNLTSNPLLSKYLTDEDTKELQEWCKYKRLAYEKQLRDL